MIRGVWAREAFVSAVLVFSVATARGEPPAELRGLPERWREAMRTLVVPGLAVVVVRDDRVIYQECFGECDPTTHRPVTPSTMFYIASTTKSFTATAVMSLVDEGRIELDAPLKRYLPTLDLGKADLTDGLTVRDALSHARGVNCMPLTMIEAFTGEMTDARYYYWLKQDTRARGSFAYSNLHYSLLGRVLAAVEGKPWQSVLEERVFKPTGLLHTTTSATRMYSDDTGAVPCERVGDVAKPCGVRKTDRTMHAAGGMGASIADLARWMRLHLNGGSIDGVRVLSPESVAQMHAMQVKLPEPNRRGPRSRDGYGLGWWRQVCDGRRMLEHGGGFDGASSVVTLVPEERLGVAVVANSLSSITDLVAFDIFKRLLKLDLADAIDSMNEQESKAGARRAELQASVDQNPVGPSGLSLPPHSFVGTYTNEHWGAVTVANRDGGLVAQLGDLSLRLRSAGTNRFQSFSGRDTPSDGWFSVNGEEVRAISLRPTGDGELVARFIRECGPVAHLQLPDGGVRLPMLFRGPEPALEVFINEQGPFVLALDTCGSGTALLSDALASRLALPEVGAAASSDGSGSRSTRLRLVALKSLRLGGASVVDLECAVRDQAPEQVSDGRPLDGILGIALFSQCVLTLDFAARTITLANGALPEPDGKSVLALDPQQQVPCVSVVAAGQTVPARLDTGNLMSVRLPFALMNQVPLGPLTTATGRGLVGERAMSEGRLRAPLIVGKHEVSNPRVHFVESFETANLGSQLLRNFAVTIDMRNRRVRLEREATGPVVEPPLIRLGVRFDPPAPNEYARVREVTTGGAAEQGGLKAGDLILAMNGRDTSGMSEAERRALCGKAEPIQMKIRRETHELELTITPRVIDE